MTRNFQWLCLILVVLLQPWLHAGTNGAFNAGIAAYQAGRFADAANLFRSILTNQPTSGALLNLGLAEWRRGRAGPAILAWEQARWIDPYDRRALDDLAYARQLTGAETLDFTWYERASAWLPFNAWAWVAGGSLWFAIGMAVLPGILRWRRSSWQQASAALGLAVFLASLPAHFGVITRTKLGIVLHKETSLRLTPTAEAELLAKLRAGEPARELRRRGEYVFVQTSRGKGWMERGQLGLICAE